jgi:hypothetical protein
MIGVGMGNERKIPRPMRIQPQPEVGNAGVVAVETERDGWGGGHRPGGYGGGGTCVGVPLNQPFIDPRTLPHRPSLRCDRVYSRETRQRRRPVPLSSIIVKAALKDDEKVSIHAIDKAMLLSDAPGPPS